ncbi:Glycoside hydrolase family 10 domain [Dillenia turbinata]|uniref:Glycoside hydrolase family 10 domain n=1 Tax=Dillenia turbinata TaxID=194707 RepID=A0AAN8ZJB6_9MAGN
MKKLTETCTLVLLAIILFISGHHIEASFYDYAATTECLEEAQAAQYGGGTLFNRTFLQSSRKSLNHGASGKRTMDVTWVQVSEGRQTVTVKFKGYNGETIPGGTVIAKAGCWSMLKGGVVVNSTEFFKIYYQGENPGVEIKVVNESLQGFTKEQWRAQQNESIERIRKRNLRVEVVYANSTPVVGARVIFKQSWKAFPLGCSMNKDILANKEYQEWFAARFKVTAFNNEMKWYSTEKKQGQENYTIPDAMVRFCKENDIGIRGHNIFWDNPIEQPEWVKHLSPADLQKAAQKRINSIVSRYKGQVIGWDVMNENLHFHFFEDMLGENASATYYSLASELDPDATMFMNEYNTIEQSGDGAATPHKYLDKLREIQSFPQNASSLKAGIGLESRFGSGPPNLPYMRSALDILGSTGLPLWLTELDIKGQGLEEAEYFEDILREGFSHPSVEGIVTWARLFDEQKSLSDVVDKLIAKWQTRKLDKSTDDRGSFVASLFLGGYNVTITVPATKSSYHLTLVLQDIPPGWPVVIHIPE